MSLSAGVWLLDMRPAAVSELGEAPAAASAPAVAPNPFGAILVGLRTPLVEPDPAPVPATAAFPAIEPENVLPARQTASLQPDWATPLPPRRPGEFAGTTNLGRLQAASNLARQNGRVAVSPPETDSRSLFEKVFGALQPSEPKAANSVLAYAAPESDVIDNRRKVTSDAPIGLDRWTAVYDISAHTVYLPDGTRLEAHSGLGDKLDDPRYVHVKMHGATPPHVYDLSLRERPFHGVRALRLTPVGEGHIFGRAGLLAHTYMLGPRGDSNGCVSFKNYDAFLRAYLNGDVKRLVVVAQRG